MAGEPIITLGNMRIEVDPPAYVLVSDGGTMAGGGLAYIAKAARVVASRQRIELDPEIERWLRALERMPDLVSLLPEVFWLKVDSGLIVPVPPSGRTLPGPWEHEPVGTVGPVPVVVHRRRTVAPLPPPARGVYYIVPPEFLGHFGRRRDVLAPDPCSAERVGDKLVYLTLLRWRR